MATRRSKRSHHDEDADAMSVTDAGSHHPVKPAAAAGGKAAAGQRRVLTDLTNKNTATHSTHAHVAKPAALVEQVEEEVHVKTRAQARSSKTREPSAKKMRFSGTEPATKQQAKIAAPIKLDEEEEEAEEDEDVEMEEASEEEYIEERDNSDLDQEDAIAEDEELLSAKSADHTTAVAGASAVVPASAPQVSTADMASWQLGMDDPSQEYSDSIYQHLRTTEMQLFPDPLYMDKTQGDLTHSMRSILIDWLSEVAEEYNLQAATFFLGVSYIDRFLSVVPIDRSKLQLVGITGLLIAAKYYEIWPPQIEDFVHISDRTYTREEVLAMENSILISLKFKLTSPTSWEFSRRFCRAAGADKRTEHLMDYLLELMLQESPSLTFRPSIIAASALFLSLYTLHITPWSERLEINTGIRVEELQQCVRVMHTIYVKTCVGQNSLKAVKEKFSRENLMCVASIKPRNM